MAGPLYPPKEKKEEESALNFGEESASKDVTGNPAVLQSPVVTTASDPIAGSDAGEQPVASIEVEFPINGEGPKKVEPSATTSPFAQLVSEGTAAQPHPLSTPIVQTKLGTYPPEHGFVTICKGCNREEIFRTNNASKVPGRCGNCGAPLLMAGEVA